MGDVGSNLMLCIGTLYLLKFYTDELGMPAYYGGIIFLVAKFFTAFTDMLTGFLLDSRKNIGPKGKFRPFILYAAVPAALIQRSSLSPPPFVCRLKRRLPPRCLYVWTFIQSDELLVWCDDPGNYQKPE